MPRVHILVFGNVRPKRVFSQRAARFSINGKTCYRKFFKRLLNEKAGRLLFERGDFVLASNKLPPHLPIVSHAKTLKLKAHS